MRGFKRVSVSVGFSAFVSSAEGFSKIFRSVPSAAGLWSTNKPKGQFNPLFPTGEEIEEEAQRLLPLLDSLREGTFFRIFKVDLDKQCPFWAREDLCSSPEGSCAVCECTDDQIPTAWKEKPVEHFVDRKMVEGKRGTTPWVKDGFLGLPGSAGEAEENFLAALSGSDTGGKPTYVDLSLNPPGFTNFKGRNIWNLIYKENCLKPEREGPPEGIVGNQVCSEEEIFQKMISGFQTAIMVLSSEYNKPFYSRLPLPLTAPAFRQSRGPLRVPDAAPRHWYNLDLFRWRIAANKEWLENLYLDFSLLVRTVAKVSGVMESCPCYTGTEADDEKSRKALHQFLHVLAHLPSASSERMQQPLFTRKHDLALRQFTNISHILDCVECEKCRLHGKVKITALQVALKAASGPNSVMIRSLERNEITALINALAYFADAVLIVGRFERRLRSLRRLVFLGIVISIWFAMKILKMLKIFRSSRSSRITTSSTETTTASEADHGGAEPEEEDSQKSRPKRRQSVKKKK